MKNFEIKKEIWIWAIMVLPMLYLAYVYRSLPQVVPTHFDTKGTANDWSDKSTLIYIVLGMTVGIYALLTVIPQIDPKKKIETMGNKYFLFKFFLMLFMSMLCIFCVQMSVAGSATSVKMVFVLIGGLFAFLGNYMQTVKPNYFIGIRTPWTLENEVVWRKTHLLGGKLFFVAGLLTMILPFVLKTHFDQVFLPIILGVSVIPIGYSYIVYRQEAAKSVDETK